MILNVPAFVVPGGGADGHATVRRLLRACEAGRLETERIVVLDRNPGCMASGLTDPRVRLEIAEWSDWLDAHLGGFGSDDHFVPYHWAPHLLRDWLGRQAERAGAEVSRGGGLPSPGVPVERTTGEGDTALSYATWTCPPTCIEPALCPHTRGAKDWSLAADLERSGPAEESLGRIVFRCLHLVWGVGTVPMAAIHAARDRIVCGLREGPRRWMVATSSHCHALAAVLVVDPLAPRVSRLAVCSSP
jgi:hypothetical protein